MKKTICMVLSFILVTALAVLAGYGLYKYNKKDEPKKEDKKCYSIDGGSYTVNFETYGGTTIDSVDVCIACAPDTYEAIPKAVKEGNIFNGWYYDSALTKKVDATKFNELTVSPKEENGCVVGYNDITLYASYETEQDITKYKKVEDVNGDYGLVDIRKGDYTKITNKTTTDFEKYATLFAGYTDDVNRGEDKEGYISYILQIYLGVITGDTCTSLDLLKTVGAQLFGTKFDVNKHLNKSFISGNYYCMPGNQGYLADPSSIKVVSKEETSDKATLVVDVLDYTAQEKKYGLKLTFNIKDGYYVFDSYEIIK